MDGYILGFHAAGLAAALGLAATGIGFGIVAGPILLMVLNSGSAGQVTILLSRVIAVVLTPTLSRRADTNRLSRWLAATLVPDTLFGILLGRISVGWISERGFRWLISILLVATSISLLVVSFKGLFGNA